MRVGIVTPWFGENLAGGAERLAWELAFGLRGHLDHVSVFTTCAGSFHDPWNFDVHRPGESEIDGVRVVRFPVDRTNSGRFMEINRKLLALPRDRLKVGAQLLDEREASDFVGQNINSTMLLSHLSRHEDEFDAVLFLPYLYGLTLRGWRIAPERTAVVPCLHDEPYAYLPPVAQMMRGAARLLFNSVGTLELARRLYGPGILSRSRPVGCGITWPFAANEADRSPIQGFVPEARRYVLYLGRRTAEKNVDLLLAAFARYCEYRPSTDLELVLAGPDEPRSQEAGPRVALLRHVSESEKSRLLRHCLALAQPSTNESFSRAMMEAWAVGRPVAVHSDCLATATALDATNAGWTARDVADWVDVFARVDASSPAELAAVGRRAEQYVMQYGAWPHVLDAYETALAEMIEGRRPKPSNGARRIVHFVEKAAYADSTTLLALQNDALLRRNGIPSVVVALEGDRRLGTLVVGPEDVRYDDVRIDYLANDRRPGATPGPSIITGVGLPRISYGGKALRGFPLFVDLEAWNVEPSLEVLTPLQDGRTNVLAVAPIAAQNHQLEIALVFRAYYTLDFDARLLLVGQEADLAYLEQLQAAIREMGLEHRIQATGEVSRPALAAMYQSAHLFVSFRDSYETGLSLLEAMAFDIPVCAIGCEQSREILAGSGIAVKAGAEPLAMASLWRVLVSDATTRQKVITSQRRRIDEMRETDALEMLTGAIAAHSGR